jgi:hypothetical protein
MSLTNPIKKFCIWILIAIPLCLSKYYSPFSLIFFNFIEDNLYIDNKLYCEYLITIYNNNHPKYTAELKYYHIDKEIALTNNLSLS